MSVYGLPIEKVLGCVLLVAALTFAAWRNGWKVPRFSSEPGVRGADEPPPPGAVDWATDIAESMSKADDTSKLKAIMEGCTRDEARAMRISEQEEVTV